MTDTSTPITPPAPVDPTVGTTATAGVPPVFLPPVDLEDPRRIRRPRDTPRRLRSLAALCVVTSLAFGVVAAFAAFSQANSLEDARANAEQLVRIQAIDTNLVQADANATNAFLVGGVEPSAQRQAYLSGIDTASTTLADAASRNELDAEALGRANTSLTKYTGLIESARANNRQGYPVGVAYLKQATQLLRSEVLPTLGDLITANDDRVRAANESTSRAGAVLWLAAAGALLVLVACQVWLLLRTRRVLNIGLALATMVIVIVGVAAGGLMAVTEQRSIDVRDHSYKSTLALARARIDAFDAKSNESLTLIARGSGDPFEAAFTARADAVRKNLTTASDAGTNVTTTRQAFTTFVDVHKRVRLLDNDGKWDEAVVVATSQSGDGSNAAFAAFDTASQRDLDTKAAELTTQLSEPVGAMRIIGWLALLGGLAAAGMCWWGIGARLKEYR